MNDPIVEEIRSIRAAHAARFNYDLWAIYRDLKEQQERSGLTYVSFADEPNITPAIEMIESKTVSQASA